MRLEDFEVLADTDVVLAGVSGNSLEISFTMEISGATECGLKVCVSPDGEEQTSIAFAPKQGTLSIDTNKSGPIGTPKAIEVAPFSLDENEALESLLVDKLSRFLQTTDKLWCGASILKETIV